MTFAPGSPRPRVGVTELGQVVDHVVIVLNGRLATEVDMATLAGEVIIRVDQTEAMLEALGRTDIRYEVTADGAINTWGADASVIGKLASTAGITVIELARISPGDRLEALFLKQTATTQ